MTPRESGETSIWSFMTKALSKPIEETKQMTAEQPAGAASHDIVKGWHDIDWHAAHSNVRRLQARIAKATQEGRWGKVKALQHLLTRSFSGKALAVKRVTENQGKETPGVDKDIWDTPQKKAKAIRELQQRGYHPLPLRRVYIPKKNGATRFLKTVISRGTRSGVFLFGKTLTTNLLMLGAIPSQSDERLITHPSCSDWSSIRKAG